jgi:2-dehydro-3-deoxyphosphogluconate aldolase / (4S)-4-hydroxy-2-oxoglutarate aldolase
MTLCSIKRRMIDKRIIPVAVIGSLENAVPLARALAEAGLPIIEVTLRTPCALDCIRAIRQQCPDVLVGAGTVLNQEQVRAAIAAGAQFGVSPGLNESVAGAARDQDWPFVPGVMTPSEVERALGFGCLLQKFFPADAAGGLKMLKSLAGPYEHAGVRFIPLGGIHAGNVAEYFTLPVVAAVGGSWLCEKKLVQEKRWTEIAALGAHALKLAAAARP